MLLLFFSSQRSSQCLVLSVQHSALSVQRSVCHRSGGTNLPPFPTPLPCNFLVSTVKRRRKQNSLNCYQSLIAVYSVGIVRKKGKTYILSRKYHEKEKE